LHGGSKADGIRTVTGKNSHNEYYYASPSDHRHQAEHDAVFSSASDRRVRRELAGIDVYEAHPIASACYDEPVWPP